MPVMTYKNGVWTNCTQLLTHNGSTYQECSSAKIFENGAWKEVYPDSSGLVLWAPGYGDQGVIKTNDNSYGSTRINFYSDYISLRSDVNEVNLLSFYIDIPVDVTKYKKLWITTDSIRGDSSVIQYAYSFLGAKDASQSPTGQVEVTKDLSDSYFKNTYGVEPSAGIGVGSTYKDITNLTGFRCFMAEIYAFSTTGNRGKMNWKISKIWLSRE